MNDLSKRPVQIRLPDELREKIKIIAQRNHLSEVAVIRLCLSQAIPAIERNGVTLTPAV